MRPFDESKEFRCLSGLFFFATVIVLASCAGIPAQKSGDTYQEQSSHYLSNEADPGIPASTPYNDNPTTEKDLQPHPVPAVHYSGIVDEQRLAALNDLAPAIYPINAEKPEGVDPFFVPIRGGGWGGGGGGGWGGGGGGGWGGGRGGGWGGGWGGGGWRG